MGNKADKRLAKYMVAAKTQIHFSFSSATKKKEGKLL